jgi:dienelactone hydrolase
MIFGTKDPHVPDAGTETIDRALKNSGARYNTLLYPAEHAFTRDGPAFRSGSDGLLIRKDGLSIP